MVGAARSAGVAMKAALVSTGIGAVIVGIGLAIEKVMSKISAANEASRALRREGGDMSRSNNEIVAARRNIGSAEEQQAVLDDLDNRIAAVRERLGNISDEYDSDEAIAAATESLNLQLNLLQRHKEGVAKTSAEYMAQVAAVRAQEQALIDAKRRAEELGKEVERAVANYDKAAAQRALDEMNPDDAERFLLGQAMVGDLSALRDLIEQQKKANDLKDYEQERLLEMIQLEGQLVDVQKRQTAEREKAAAQAARLADMQADMVLDSEKAVAEAMGDKAAVRAIEIEQKTRRLASQLESQGEDPTAAREIARQKAELMQLAGEINASPMAQIARGDAQRSIGLGGSAGLGPSVDVQKEIARKQEAANRLLADIKTALNNRTPVMLAEVFD